MKTKSPSEEQLNQWFFEFNNEFFSGCLPTVKVCYTKLAFTSFGQFSSSHQTYNRITRKWVIKLDPDKSYIYINNMFYSDNELFYKSILLHEMVHLYQHAILTYAVKSGHGKEFEKIRTYIESKSKYKLLAADIRKVVNIYILKSIKTEFKDTHCSGYIVTFKKNGKYFAGRIYPNSFSKIIKYCENNNYEKLKFYAVKSNDDDFYIKTCIPNKDLCNYIMCNKSETNLWKDIKEQYKIRKRKIKI